MESVKKSIGERAQHKMEYESRVNERQIQTTEEKTDTSNALDASSVIIESNGTESKEQDTSSRSGNDAHVDDAEIRPIYDEEPMAEVQMTADDNVSATGQQHTEQPEFINEGEVDQNAEQCHDICPLPAKLTDNRTTELSNQLLESENVCLKKTVAQCQKDFAKLEAHCINLELQMQNNVLKSGQQSQFSKVKSNEAKVKHDIDIPKGHRFSIKKTTTVHVKTTTPRSCLRWQPTGRILKTVCLRWVPTGKTFASSTTKVESEPPNGSNADITNQCESKQALNVSAGTLLSTGTSFNPTEEGLRVWLRKRKISQKTGLQGIAELISDASLGLHGATQDSYIMTRVGITIPPSNSNAKDNSHKVVRLGINPMIQPEPEDLPKDNPKLEIAVLRVILFSIHNDEWKSFQCHHQTALRLVVCGCFIEQACRDYSLTIGIFVRDKMRRDQTDGEAMIKSIQNGDHPLPVVAQVSLAGTAPNAPPTLKDPQFWTAEEKKNRKIDRLARSLLIQGLLNDIYSLIDSNDTAKDLWDALERQMRGSEYGEQDRKAAILYEYETFKATKGEQLLDTYLRYLQVINVEEVWVDKKVIVRLHYKFLKQSANKCGKHIIRKSVAEKTLNSEQRKVESCSTIQESEGSVVKIYQSNKKPEYVKSEEKKEDKKVDEKKWDMSKVKCYNCKKEGHFAKDCKKAKVKDYNYYKTKMLLAKKDSDEQVFLLGPSLVGVLLVIKIKRFIANMVFMAKMEKVLSDSEESSSSAEETIAEVSYYTSDSESESEYENCCNYYDYSTNYGLFVNNDDDQEIFHDAIESASENFNENHIVSQTDHDSQKGAHASNDAMSVSCNSRLYASCDVNDLFVFDDIVQICLWIIDSGCSKHMTGNRALLTNFVEKFLGTVRFGNNDFAVIAGYFVNNF
ncbi:retrovirus-related pol polyprotein from transposon TNT 1-94 [Tanacetum coccineum]|uniref:Retrovirus-related pol polyprotein from transposon TNT 1-94 n=1 Tax=Tanacetum coccineum TaxID=301880 RepID=A0ABQ4XXC2_9ASTR